MKETATERANRLSCYCFIWDTEPDFYPQQGIPEGFCGICDVCGKPGHTRHFPGSVPFTGAWCDKHYRQLAFTHPYGHYGCSIYLGAVTAIAFLVWLLLA